MVVRNTKKEEEKKERHFNYHRPDKTECNQGSDNIAEIAEKPPF